MDYEHEKQALEYTLDGMVADFAVRHLRQLTQDQLNKFADALDALAVLTDQEAIHRIPKRTHLSE